MTRIEKSFDPASIYVPGITMALFRQNVAVSSAA